MRGYDCIINGKNSDSIVGHSLNVNTVHSPSRISIDVLKEDGARDTRVSVDFLEGTQIPQITVEHDGKKVITLVRIDGYWQRYDELGEMGAIHCWINATKRALENSKPSPKTES